MTSQSKPQTNIDHVSLSVSSLDASIEFYSRLFGFQLVERSGNEWGILRSGDSMICMWQAAGFQAPKALSSHHEIYHFGLRIRDRSAFERQVAEGKVNVSEGPVRYPHSTSWYVKDPSGYEVEVAAWDEDRVQFG